MKNHIVTIGNTDITKAVADFSYTQKLNAMTVGTVKLRSKELLELPPLNYAAEMCLSKSQESGDKLLFRGNITSVVSRFNEIDMDVATGIDLLEETLVQMAVAHIDHRELAWSLARGAGLDEEHIKIPGFQKGPIEPFELLVPIHGIELSKDVSFSEFELTSDPKVVDIANTISKDKSAEILTEFAQAGLWLRLIVRATTIYDAEIEGIKQIDVFLSRLTSRIQLSLSRLGDYQGNWNRNRLFGTPMRGDAVLVRGLTTKRRWLRKPFGGNASIIDVAKLPDVDFPPLAHELPLYLTEAFLAWQRSVHANHPLAAITAIWDAIEFYSSQIKIAADFTKAETKQIRKDAVQSLDEKDDKKRSRVADVLNMLNQASLIMKFGLAMKEDGITLSDEEMNVLKKLRETRNNFVHGKEVTIPTDTEMLLARTVVNRILVARVFRLTRPIPETENLFS